MNTNETLIAARAIIERGWNKYGMTDGEGRFCLKAAIGLACGAYEMVGKEVGMPRLDYQTATGEQIRARADALRAELTAMEVVRHWLPAEFDCIPLFNDDPRTGQNEVLAVLDDAILFTSAQNYAVATA
jgi:hypothetical protein